MSPSVAEKAPGGAATPEGPGSRGARLARLLDARYRVPGTSVTFGWDAILGLVPGVGDWLTSVPALWFMGRALLAGAPFTVILRMAGYALVDLAFGIVPVLGDLFDVFWKSNVKSARLLDAWLAKPERTRRRSRLGVGLVLLAVGAVYVGLSVLATLAVVRIVQAIRGG